MEMAVYALLPHGSVNLSGAYLAFNQVPSCAGCNLRRGATDPMVWHRRHQTFPTLSVLRRYLKLCWFYAGQQGYGQISVGDALARGLPFDPAALPRMFPPVQDLVWDHAYPDKKVTFTGSLTA